MLRPLHAVLGLLLFVTLVLPFTPDGGSLLAIVWWLTRMTNPVSGLMALALLGAPQLFGLAVAIASRQHEPAKARLIVAIPLASLQLLVLFFGLAVWNDHHYLAPNAMVGFSVVTSIAYLVAIIEANASERQGVSLYWQVRWGALLIAGTGLWLHLQYHLAFGIAVEVGIVAAVLLLVISGRPPRDQT